MKTSRKWVIGFAISSAFLLGFGKLVGLLLQPHGTDQNYQANQYSFRTWEIMLQIRESSSPSQFLFDFNRRDCSQGIKYGRFNIPSPPSNVARCRISGSDVMVVTNDYFVFINGASR
jgi:hypothetical protein